MLEELKLLANKRDVPYQSLVKVFLSDRIEEELTGRTGVMISWLVERQSDRRSCRPSTGFRHFCNTLPAPVWIMALLSYICHRIHFGTVIA
ncbi:MAG: hypothetical protein ABSD38_35945 [Syntrophorhabdales bacterium]